MLHSLVNGRIWPPRLLRWDVGKSLVFSYAILGAYGVIAMPIILRRKTSYLEKHLRDLAVLRNYQTSQGSK